MSKLEKIDETDALIIFSPKLDGKSLNEFYCFLSFSKTLSEQVLIKDREIILSVIKKMMRDCGARENLFRPEGSRNDNVAALPTLVERRTKDKGVLRLYCIRVSDRILIIGNGGIKKVQKYQEDKQLFSYVSLLQHIDRRIQARILKDDIDIDDTPAVITILENLSF